MQPRILSPRWLTNLSVLWPCRSVQDPGRCAQRELVSEEGLNRGRVRVHGRHCVWSGGRWRAGVLRGFAPSAQDRRYRYSQRPARVAKQGGRAPFPLDKDDSALMKPWTGCNPALGFPWLGPVLGQPCRFLLNMRSQLWLWAVVMFAAQLSRLAATTPSWPQLLSPFSAFE